MRLFVAVELPESAKPAFESMQFKLRGRGLVRARHPHLTLKFIGEAEPEPIIETLSKIQFNSFNLTTNKLDFFPNVSNPRVLFLGVKSSLPLDELAAKIRDAIPVSKDEHPFHAHFTIFRLRKGFHKAHLKNLITQVRFRELRFPVSTIVLKRSVLTPNGPEYSTLASFPAKDL